MNGNYFTENISTIILSNSDYYNYDTTIRKTNYRERRRNHWIFSSSAQLTSWKHTCRISWNQLCCTFLLHWNEVWSFSNFFFVWHLLEGFCEQVLNNSRLRWKKELVWKMGRQTKEIEVDTIIIKKEKNCYKSVLKSFGKKVKVLL